MYRLCIANGTGVPSYSPEDSRFDHLEHAVESALERVSKNAYDVFEVRSCYEEDDRVAHITPDGVVEYYAPRVM